MAARHSSSRPRPKLAPVVLTIAGSDSGGGAGIQADARTIHALGGFACTAITAITAQNTRGISAWRAVSLPLLTAQINTVLADLPVAAIKTGLLPGKQAVLALARLLEKVPHIPLVVDPVIRSTAGTRFLDAAAARTLRRELLPLATLVTPNWPEIEALTGHPVKNYEDAEIAAETLVAHAGCAVLLKGGHAPDRDRSRDYLVPGLRPNRWFSSPRVATRNTHGTGCVLSAAIATRLAHGDTLEQAVAHGRAFLQRSLRAHARAPWGGAGPAFPGQ